MERGPARECDVVERGGVEQIVAVLKRAAPARALQARFRAESMNYEIGIWDTSAGDMRQRSFAFA